VEALLAAVPKEGLVGIDPDTVMCPESGEAALRASGAVIAAIDAVVAGEDSTAFCAVRPPGHHAEAGRGMGFCLFNNVAIGAMHARAAHAFGRVAIVDFDVHHGNGTQHMFEDEPSVLAASSPPVSFYPGTGAAEERGVGSNAPLAAGSGSTAFRHAFERVILPALTDFAPDLVLISAGFDAHARDPWPARARRFPFAWSHGSYSRGHRPKRRRPCRIHFGGGYDCKPWRPVRRFTFAG
jgi:acetoin utilization deacetylase AcuC-like enzyme